MAAFGHEGAVKALFRSGRWQWLLIVASAAGMYLYARVLDKSYPIDEWLFWKLAYVWCATLLLNLGALCSGYVVLTRVLRQRDLPLIEAATTSFALGLTGIAWVLALVGSAGLFKPWVAVLIAVLAVAAGAPSALVDYRAREREGLATLRFGPLSVSAALAGVCATFLIYLLVLAPDTFADDGSTLYLLAAQDYARTGKWIPFFSDLRRASPDLTSLLYTWAFLWPGLGAPAVKWMLALHLEFSCLLWTLAGVAAVARWMLGKDEQPSTWTAFFLFPVAFVYKQNLGGAADQILAAFAAPSFLASARLFQRLEWRRAVLLGLLSGGALFTKYQGAYLVFGNGVLLLGAAIARLAAAHRGRANREAPSIPWRLTALVLVSISSAALFVLLPYFAKNWLYYESPFYPLVRGASEPGQHSLPDEAASFWTDSVYVPKGPLWASIGDALRLGVTWPFHPHNDVSRKVPMLGAIFILLSPFALLVRDRRRIWWGIAVVYAATVAWGSTYFFDRDLQIIVPLMAAVSAAVIVRVWKLGMIARFAIAPIIALEMVWGGDALFYFGNSRILSSVNLINSGFSHRADKRFLYRESYVNASAVVAKKKARILCHDERALLGFDHDLVFDSPRYQTFVRYENIHSVRQLYDYYKSLGITHLCWSQSSKERLPKQTEVLFARFIFEYAKTRKTFGPLKIATMPKTPPSDLRRDDDDD